MFRPFELPSEVLLGSLFAQFPCRDSQIRSLSTLLSTFSPSPRNLVLYGSEATGKSAITAAVLAVLSASVSAREGDEDSILKDTLRYAIVKSKECITGRHLLETTVSAVADAVGWKDGINRCENLAQLAVALSRLLEQQSETEGDMFSSRRRFVLVFDGIDKQKDPPATLMPALARLGELIPHLTIIYIVTSPRPHFLHTPGVPHIYFPAYTRPEAIQILALAPPAISSLSPSDPTASLAVWSRFVAAAWDSLGKHSGRDILSLRTLCTRLWPAFTQPLRDGLFAPKDFHRLLIAKRSLLQVESVLVPSIVAATTTPRLPGSGRPHFPGSGIATQLPHASRLLLIAAYLASYTPPRHDALLFTKSSAARARRKKGGGTALSRAKPGVSRSRKISRKLLGPQAFVLERLLAIFHAMRHDADVKGREMGPGAADVMMAVATLASLRLVVRTSAVADVLDATTKWKVNVGWEVVRSVARTVGIEVEDFMIE